MEVGTIIRFRYTGARAEILEDYMDGSYAVWLFDDNEESVAFAEDIIPEEYFTGTEQSDIEKSINKKKKPKQLKKLSTEEMFFSKEELERKKTGLLQQTQKSSNSQKKENTESRTFEAVEIRGTASADKGVWLAFVEQEESLYTIYLINDSSYSLKFNFALHFHQQQEQSLKKTIPPYQYFPIGAMQHAQLNDSPVITFNCPGLKLNFEFRIKYKKWIKLPAQAPLLGIECHCKQLFSLRQIEQAQLKKIENLQDYTHQQLKERVKEEVINHYYNENDAQRLAHFDYELDLHIENLIDDSSELTPAEIFEIQQLALNKYMQQAIELGVKEVFIIHGIGKGKLRNAVMQQLKKLEKNKEIREYRNEYIPKYGFGATHVRI